MKGITEARSAVHAKNVTAAFDGGRLTSNGGVMLLAMTERRLGLADNLARVFPVRRDPHKARSWDHERRTVARIERKISTGVRRPAGCDAEPTPSATAARLAGASFGVD